MYLVIRLRKFPFISSFLKVFYSYLKLNFIKCFFHFYRGDDFVFFILILLTWLNYISWFWYQTSIPFLVWTWLLFIAFITHWVINLLIFCWGFLSLCSKEGLTYNFHFLLSPSQILVSTLCLPYRISRGVFPLLCFWMSLLCKNYIYFFLKYLEIFIDVYVSVYIEFSMWEGFKLCI